MGVEAGSSETDMAECECFPVLKVGSEYGVITGSESLLMFIEATLSPMAVCSAAVLLAVMTLAVADPPTPRSKGDTIVVDPSSSSSGSSAANAGIDLSDLDAT